MSEEQVDENIEGDSKEILEVVGQVPEEAGKTSIEPEISQNKQKVPWIWIR